MCDIGVLRTPQIYIVCPRLKLGRSNTTYGTLPFYLLLIHKSTNRNSCRVDASNGKYAVIQYMLPPLPQQGVHWEPLLSVLPPSQPFLPPSEFNANLNNSFRSNYQEIINVVKNLNVEFHYTMEGASKALSQYMWSPNKFH